MRNSGVKIFFALCFIISCKSADTSSNSEFNEFLASLNLQKKGTITAYVVLPVDICPSCVETYRSFIKNIPFSNLMFILSGGSPKKLRLTFGADILELDNVILDDKGLFYKTSFYKDAGQIFYLDENRLVKIKEIGIANLNDELESLAQFAESKYKPSGRAENSNSLDDFINGLLNSKEESPYFSHLIGMQLPSFEGTTIKGESFELSDFIGKPMVLNFWFINCPNCYEEIPDINNVYMDSKKEDFIFMSFCRDEKALLMQSFESTGGDGYKRKKSNKENQIMYYDFVPAATKIVDQLQIKAFPVTLTVGKDGKITKVIPYTKSLEFPDELITYRLIKAEIERIKNNPS